MGLSAFKVKDPLPTCGEIVLGAFNVDPEAVMTLRDSKGAATSLPPTTPEQPAKASAAKLNRNPESKWRTYTVLDAQFARRAGELPREPKQYRRFVNNRIQVRKYLETATNLGLD